MNSLRWLTVGALFWFVWPCLYVPPALASGLLHHDIELTVDPNDGKIAVTDRITVSGRRTVTLSVAPWMHMSDIRVDGNPMRGRASRTSLLLTLPSIERHQIDVVAKGIIPQKDEDMVRQRAGQDAVALSDGLYLPGWTRWFPSTSDSAASYRLTIETPAAHRAAATGELQSEGLGTQANRSVFASQPSLEPPSVFAGPYTVTERRFGKIRLRTYFHRSAANLAGSYLEAAEGFISQFEQQIGAYPFSDFHIVTAPLPVGLGFPNLAYVDRRILRMPFMRGRSLAHEVLHNWWGNGIQVDYESGNWSEGLTTYMADHALAERRDPRESSRMRLSWLRDFQALPKDKDIPVTRFLAKRHDAAQVVGYGKVAFIFHMLKHQVGSQQFETALKRFWANNKFATAGWSDIREAFEATTQSDLGWFFRQWTDRAGAPRLTLKDARVWHRAEGYALEISLAQTAPAFKLKVPLEIKTQAGLLRTHIQVEGEAANEVVQLDSKPVSLRIDPDHSLFRLLLPGEAPPILRDVLLDSGAQTLVLQDELVSPKLARELAVRLFDDAPIFLDDGQDQLPAGPLLVLGSANEISQFISRFGLPARPVEVAGRGSGRVWTVRRKDGEAALFIEVNEPGALTAMKRPLPHYRSKSYIVFEGPRAIAHGVWPAADGPLARNFD